MVTIPDTERRTTYAPATATTGFLVNFPIFNDDDVLVYLDGVLETGWTMEATYVNGVSEDAVVRADGDGWTDVDVNIVGAYRPRRTDQFADGRGVPAKDQNLILNRLIATAREAFDLVARAIVAPWGETLLPLPTLEAGKALVVNADEDGFEMGPTAADIADAQANAEEAAASAAEVAILTAGVASASSLAIGTGTKVFAVAAGLPLSVGTYVLATSGAGPTSDWMLGQITAYVGTSLTVAVDRTAGSGTHTDWTLRISGPTGPAGVGTGDMLKSENLSGLSSYPTARTNMGLGALAVLADILFANLNAGAVASQVDAEAGTATNKLMTPQRVAQLLAALNPFSAKFLHVRDEKAQGTDGGTHTSGAWRTRTLNTTKTNEISGASLGSNQITLPAGTYYAEAAASAWGNSGIGDSLSQARLQNVTGGVTLILGRSAALRAGGNAFVSGRFTLAGAAAVELQHIIASTLATNGFGQSANLATEVYSEVKIWKTA